jgi:two-component system response regulator VicR
MKKILIIEEDELFLKMIQFKLRFEGFLVFHSIDVARIKDDIAKQHPDLIIADISCSDNSGLATLKFLKKEYPQIPIIVLTSLYGEEEIVEKALEIGVNDFVTKPFNPNELLMRIKRIS